MPITSVILYRSMDVFPQCPQCGSAIEREYQGFCDRCGQKLNWKKYPHSCTLIRL